MLAWRATTYTDLVKFFGDQGAYFDIDSESNNLFQIPDLRNLPDNQRQDCLDGHKEFLVKAPATMTAVLSMRTIPAVEEAAKVQLTVLPP